jgi:hypothetical protein
MHSNARYHCFILLVSARGVIISNILDSIFTTSGKSKVQLYIWLTSNRIRIRQGDAVRSGSGSGSTTLAAIILFKIILCFNKEVMINSLNYKQYS